MPFIETSATSGEHGRMGRPMTSNTIKFSKQTSVVQRPSISTRMTLDFLTFKSFLLLCSVWEFLDESPAIIAPILVDFDTNLHKIMSRSSKIIFHPYAGLPREITRV